MTARHSPLFSLESGQSGLRIYTTPRDAPWGATWVGDDNLLDVYIRYLRKKVERPELEPLIHTVRGVGFMLQ